MVYLDFAASTPLLPSVKTELFRSFQEDYSNPSSVHQMGQSSADKIDIARGKIAESIGAYKRNSFYEWSI